MTTTDKQRTVTLTDRPPVRISEGTWPVIASTHHRPGSMRNGTPVPDYETDSLRITVRQHADGRTIVYAVVDAATVWTGTQDSRGGELLDAGADIAAAIRRVGERNGCDSIVDECIADLPAEELT